ncbi:MAG: hypothetical protein WC456_04655 [Patescibacteria group bacterium]
MLATSTDVLHLVLALCAAVLTFFICWAIYYFIASAQRIFKLIRKVEEGVTKIEEVVDLAKNKLKNSSAYFMILAELAKKAMEFVKEKKEKKEAAKRVK